VAPVGKKSGSGQGRVRQGRRGPIIQCQRRDAAGRRCQRRAMVIGAQWPAQALSAANCGDGRHDFTPPKQDRTGQQKQTKR